MYACTHCALGALCTPPSNLGGITLYVAFPAANGSRASSAEPAVPGSSERSNLASRVQHSRVETPSCALMAVMSSVLGVFGVKACAWVCRDWSRARSRMVEGFMFRITYK